MHFSIKETTMEAMLHLIRSGSKERNIVISALYKDEKLKNGIKKIIGYHNGDTTDFEDIFNHTLVQFLKSAMTKSDFNIKTNLNSYLFGIAKFLWLKKLKSNKVKTTTYPEDFEIKDDVIQADLHIIENEKKALLHKVLSSIGKNCKEVLMYWASGVKMSEIADKLGYASDVVARRKKFTCMQQMSKYMNNNPGLKETFRS